MAVRSIVTIPDKRLYQVSKTVDTFDRNLRNLVRDMFDSMYQAGGVGLAAVQIGELKRVLVIDLVEAGFIKGVFINPMVVDSSKEMQEGDEGCLSVPGISAPLKRPKWVKVQYQDISGDFYEVEGEMLMARALLHEMDHLDGKVYVDLLEPDMKLSIAEDLELVKKGLPPKESKTPKYRQKEKSK